MTPVREGSGMWRDAAQLACPNNLEMPGQLEVTVRPISIPGMERDNRRKEFYMKNVLSIRVRY